MSDPFSATGSAVGVISLGLVVCGEIVAYGRGYRDYGEDIRNMTTKAESLCVPLRTLREMIEKCRITQPDAAADLSEKAMSINVSVTRLQDILKRYGPNNAPEDFSDKARNQLKRALYHFRKDALRDMAADLDSIQTILQTTLSVYSWKLNLHVSQEIQQMVLVLPILLTFTDITEHLTLKNGMPPPSLLKSWCDEQNKRQWYMTTNSNALSEKTALIRHRQRVVTKRYDLYSRWLGLVIEISFNMTTGAGGLSICPALKIPILVVEGSAEYKYINKLLKSLRRDRGFDSAFLTLQDQFSSQKMHPSCVMAGRFGINSLLDAFFCDSSYCLAHQFDLQNYSKIIGFLLDNGVRATLPDCNDANLIWGVSRLEDEHVLLIARLVDAGFSFDINAGGFPFGPHTKHNLQLILSKSDELVQITESARLICRENAEELRKALRQRQILPNEKIEKYPLLEWAFGWAEGVKILLEFGADARQCFRSLIYRGVGYHRSATLLLRAGCLFSKDQLNDSVSCNDGGERMLLLVNELVARRKKLRKLAEASLPSTMIPSFTERTLLDGPDCLKIYDLLVSRKIDVPNPFPTRGYPFPLRDGFGKSIYHALYRKQCAEALYDVGFRDTDMLDLEGNSPLGSLGQEFPYYHPKELIEVIHWHISKGANLNRQLPWTNESVAHLLTLKVIHNCLSLEVAPESNHSLHVSEIEKALQELSAMGINFLLPTTISDGCSCPCSPGGCTAVSVILRELTSLKWYKEFDSCLDCYRTMFNLLHEWNQSYWQDSQAFIRSLTFNALDLTHTCFGNTKKGKVLWRNLYPNDEGSINEVRDEESSLDEFEKLLAELEQNFDKLRLPLKEFLAGYWYRRVKDHLLTPQPLKEQHIAGARSIGVELEFFGLFVPDWIENLVAPKVEEVNDEDSGDDNND